MALKYLLVYSLYNNILLPPLSLFHQLVRDDVGDVCDDDITDIT